MNITTLSPKQLRAAADLKERIDPLQEQLNAILGGGEIAALVAPEAPAKPKNGRRKRRKKVSAEGRANISAAAKARWAARRGETQSETAPAAEPVKRKRRISRALRQARSAAMKAMWAKARKAGKSRL
jgi:hypothetical protein